MKRLLVAYLIIIGILWFPTPVSADKTYSEPIATPQPVENIPRIDLIEPISTADDIKELEYITVEPKAFIAPTMASSGNLYDFHSCTWYAKERRPDLPNNLGNADTWFSRAQAQGIPTGYEARAGAIGQQGMHVVYIERVEGDMVYLSERNYDYNGSYRERYAPSNNFLYIY